MSRLPREGQLYELGDRAGLEALRRRIHKDACACRGAIESCRGLNESEAA